MCDGSGRSLWSYDAYGRVTQEQRLIDGSVYTTQSTYDAFDRVRTLAYPDDGSGVETLTYSYGADTRLSQIVSSIGSLHLIDSATYNAFGLPTSVGIGSGPLATLSQTYWGI